MAGDEAMIVAGVGFRGGAGADEIVALVERALALAAAPRGDLARLATVQALADAPAFQDAARRLAAAGLGVDEIALQGADARVLTRSERSLKAHGVGSVAEAAALAAAGFGSTLLLARISSPAATCALARGNLP
ncbi:cobalamin biosynthesis protein [Salinarimonas soli]|uniref:Cobalamin biosynthesis protein n=1 Tax=Salinarimonas soli TaxID=1638099 RepID=A0A5B2VRA7_9HYPH|nr:cobalamin biosynthesis protein [Salinarimonas soli]KAA2242313.1 cobalamin biosynthesis protein [Salinarimonas soli]